MLGSASSVSCANTVLNTSVAEELKQFADELESADDFESALHELIKRVIKEHKRIIFNGDGYDDSWLAEAERRGLKNLKTTPDALAHMMDEKNVRLFTDHKVFTVPELASRHEVRLENYCKVINIEALTMLDMVRKDILPAMSTYSCELADGAAKKAAFMPETDCSYEKDMVKSISALLGAAFRAVRKTEDDLLSSKSIEGFVELADFYKTTILDDMRALRIAVDELETIAPAEKWPYPSYGEMLFSVR